MAEPKRTSARAEEKQFAVFDAAADVFARYGFKRTTMNDIAEAAGISRPALYLMFDNKEHLFHELAAYRINLALDAASKVLADAGNVNDRFINALMIFEKVYTEPVANSPHGEELIDVNLSLASDVMAEGHAKLVATLTSVLKEADEAGEVNFQNTAMNHKAFVELLLSSIKGIKKMASSKEEYRKQTQQVARIFLQTIAT